MGATRIETPQLTVPAGTPVSAPVSVSLFAQRAQIIELETVVPPGPSGLVGFSFWHSNAQVIPKIAGTWVIADNETLRWQLEDLSAQPAWLAMAYNLDVFDHTLYFRLQLDDRVPVPSGSVALVEIE